MTGLPAGAPDPDVQGYRGALSAIDRFVASLHEVDSPFEFATTLVQATATQYDADIATLFRVTPSKTELVAEAGFNRKGEQLRAIASYPLPWGARSEAEMPGGGLTTWVAVSGKPLFIQNAEELLDKTLHPAHRGAWDKELHPTGPQNTFGCLYAVPLRIVGQGGRSEDPRASVLGVYKIERRSDNSAGVFTPAQLQEFDLAAKQLSLVILLYERALARILSDARHAVAGRLADVAGQLDAGLYRKREAGSSDYSKWLLQILERSKSDVDKVTSWLRQSIQVYSNPTDMENRKLSEFVKDTIEARANHATEVTQVVSREDGSIQLPMTVAQSWDLHTLLLSLLNNAIQHSGCAASVSLSATVRRSSRPQAEPISVTFTIADAGSGISPLTLQEAQLEGGPMGLTASSGTGLRRVFRVARFRGWLVRHDDASPGTRFSVEVGMPRRG
jgi:signal transduction histidine kinase